MFSLTDSVSHVILLSSGVKNLWPSILCSWQVLPPGLERLLVLCCVTTTAQQRQLRRMNNEERSETLPSQLNMRFLAVHFREETRIAGVIELTMRVLMGPILYSLSLSIFQGKWLQLKMELFIGTDSASDLWAPTSYWHLGGSAT